jgi:hypothetical protein
VAAAEFAVLGGIIGALVTALSAAAIAYYQSRSTLREGHRIRAFERHLTAYERMFAACRSAQDALSDYAMVERNSADRSDPFLRQVLDILRTCAYQYCASVDWRHNPGMAYLDIALEEKCLHMRDLLLLWLSRSRLSYGDVATIRRDGLVSRISELEIRRMRSCDYQELQIERKVLVLRHDGDAKLISDIHEAASMIIKDLKAVMSY